MYLVPFFFFACGLFVVISADYFPSNFWNLYDYQRINFVCIPDRYQPHGVVKGYLGDACDTLYSN